MQHSLLTSSEKITIILAALQERYTALHAIRARVESIGVWAIGLALAAGGWLLQTSVVVSWNQRGLLIAGTLLALLALRFQYLADLNRGFKSQQVVAARLEVILGLYSPGLFDQELTGPYPDSWREAGTSRSSGRFFRTTYFLLYISAAFLVASIVASGTL